MKYKDQRELVEGLRALADFIETHPELPVDDPYVKVDWWIYDDHIKRGRTAKEKMRLVARAMGTARKDYSSWYFDLNRKFGKLVTLEFTTHRENVCERVVKEVIHHPEEIVPQKVIAARTEEVIEWVCDDPLLAS